MKKQIPKLKEGESYAYSASYPDNTVVVKSKTLLSEARLEKKLRKEATSEYQALMLMARLSLSRSINKTAVRRAALAGILRNVQVVQD